MGNRIVKDMTQFADVITEIGGGWKTTFVYVNRADFKLTAQAVNLDKFSTDLDADHDLDTEVAGNLRGFANGPQKRSNRFPYAGIVKVAKYTLNWQSARNHMKNYDNFVSKSDEIASKYAAQILKRQGLPLTQDALDSVLIKSRAQRDYENQENGNTNAKTREQRKDYRVFKDYGNGGMWVRPNDNDRVVCPQNMKTVKPGGTDYYLIKTDGSIAGGRPVSLNTLKEILSSSGGSDKSKVGALKKLGANEEEIAQYTKEFGELNWGENDFMADQILYAVASCTDDFHSNEINKVMFYNKELISNIVNSNGSVTINPQEFLAIAKKEIQDVYGLTVESANKLFKKIINECLKSKKQTIRLTESALHRIIKESVKRILTEDIKGVDTKNIVPEPLALKYGFKREYADQATKLEVWGRDINEKDMKYLMHKLQISRYTNVSRNIYPKVHVRITVKPSGKKKMALAYDNYQNPNSFKKFDDDKNMYGLKSFKMPRRQRNNE